MKKFLFFVLVFSISSSAGSISKDISRARLVQIIQLKNIVNLDGKLVEPLYSEYQPVSGFIQRDPNEGESASEKTDVWISYDENHLYFSAKLYDSNPDSIDLSLMRRDNHTKTDWFYVYIDPYFDRRTGYYFAVNAGGSLSDGVLFNDSWNDSSWDGIWEAKTEVNGDGWSVEMKIPFSQLRFKEADDMKWGINFARGIKRKNETSYLIMVPKNESGFVSHFATLEGLRGIKPKQRFEVLPYVVQKAQYLIHDEQDPFYKSKQYQTSAGADIKLGIGSNLTLDGTINPDFGQVEVDPAVVNLSAFETYYDEKRPFFIEGNTIFYFGRGGSNNNWNFNFGTPSLFYSRRIGRSPQGSVSDYNFIDYPKETNILCAAKLTGKLNDSWSIGALSAVTQRMFATLRVDAQNIKEEVEPLTHYGVFRAKKEFNEGRDAFGMMFTSVNRDLRGRNLRESLVEQAYTLGIDGWKTLDEDENYVITATAIGSIVDGTKEAVEIKQRMPYRYFQNPENIYIPLDTNRNNLAGWFTRIMLNKQKGNFYINSAVGAVSPGFEYNDMGFQWMADRINGHVVLGYRWYEPDKIFRRKNINFAYFRTYNFTGDLLNNTIFTVSNFQFVNYYDLFIQGFYSFEGLNNRATRGGPFVKEPSGYNITFGGNTDTRETMVLNFNTSYTHDKLNSEFIDIGFDLEWKPDSKVSIQAGPSYSVSLAKDQWVGNFDDDFAKHTFNRRYVFAELDHKTISGNLRVNCTFTPQLSLQVFIQPIFSVGKYANFKELAAPRTSKYNVYSAEKGQIKYDKNSDEYFVDPDGDGSAQGFGFSNPNFNYKSVRGNIVLRYEVLPGSVFYFVWTHDKTNFDHPGEFKFSRDFNNLINSESNNIFLVKFSYWFDA